MTPRLTPLLLILLLYFPCALLAQNTDAVLRVTNLGEFVEKNKNINIEFIVQNAGSSTIQNAEVHWSLDGETMGTYSVNLNLPPRYYTSRTHTTPLRITDDQPHEFRIWIESLRPEDGNNANNDITFQIQGFDELYPRTVLVEKATATWCGYCPIAGYDLKELKTDYGSQMAVAAFHSNDDFTIPEVAALLDRYNYTGTPTGMLDRLMMQGTMRPFLGFPSAVPDRTGVMSPVQIELESAWDNASRELTVTVHATFSAALTGDFLFNAYLTEDSIPGVNLGPGQNYAQRNYMDDDRNSPFYGMGDPIEDYYHMNVVRAVPGGADGTEGIIPQTIEAGQTYTHTYTVSIDEDWQLDQLNLIGFVTRGTNLAESSHKVIGAAHARVPVPTDRAEKQTPQTTDMTIFPNPTAGTATIMFAAQTNESVRVVVRNLLGRTMLEQAVRPMGNHTCRTTIDAAGWPAGMYTVEVANGNAREVRKLMLNR